MEKTKAMQGKTINSMHKMLHDNIEKANDIYEGLKATNDIAAPIARIILVKAMEALFEATAEKRARNPKMEKSHYFIDGLTLEGLPF